MVRALAHASCLSVALLWLASACSSEDATPDAGADAAAIDRGRVLRAEPQPAISRVQLEQIRDSIGLPGLPAPQFDVACTALIYETIDVRGARAEASGLVCVPIGATGPRPLLSYQHGTVSADADVPSSRQNASAIFFALLYASGGYAIAAADYLGLGAAPGSHPYLHAASEATASVDMIRATQRHASETGVELGAQLFLAGYSQGGHATMALHRALEAEHAAELPVTASMPMAGPYDLSTTTFDAAFATPAPSTPAYLAYLLLAYDAVYDVYPSPEAAFVDSAQVAALFDRTHAFADIAGALPSAPEALLRPDFLTAIRRADHPFRAALRANDVYDWLPRAPVRLCHGGADRDVVFENAVVARDRMKALGGDVEIVAVGAELDHDTAGIPCELEARRLFDAMVPSR
ncbi:MAG: lipase family protein [Kofleriaceae bacterium]